MKAKRFVMIFSKKAFTLSEVMLVLSVIGVIAALTIPGIMQNTQNKQTVTRLKKEYSTLQQAFTTLLADNEGDITSIFSGTGTASDNVNVLNTFASKLNILKNCGSGANAGCFPSGVTYKKLNGNTWVNLDSDAINAKAILADGSIVYLSDYTGTCASVLGTAGSPLANVCGHIGVDINGSSGPNQLGRDVFTFWITQSGIYPLGSYNDTRDCSSVGDGCANKILSENNMNY